MGLVGGAAAAGNDVDNEDPVDGDDGDDGGPETTQAQAPAPQAPGPRRPGRAREDLPSRGAVAVNSLCRQLGAGEQLLVERVGGQGPRGFLCTLTVDGPMRWPEDVVAALQAAGYSATGELELSLCDPNTGRLIHRVIAPTLAAPGANPQPFGAAGGVPTMPAVSGSSDMAAVLAACMGGMAQMTTALSTAVMNRGGAPAGGGHGGGEAVEILRAELAKRDADIKALREQVESIANGGSDDDEEDPVDRTVSTINKLNEAGMISKPSGDFAAAAVKETTTVEDWSGVLKVMAPGVVDLLRAIAHELGQFRRMRFAFEAAKAGITISEIPQGSVQAPAAGGSSSGGEGAAGGGA